MTATSTATVSPTMPRHVSWPISVLAFGLVGYWTVKSVAAIIGHRIVQPELVRDLDPAVTTLIAGIVVVAFAYYEGPARIGFGGSAAYTVRVTLGAIVLLATLASVVYAILLTIGRRLPAFPWIQGVPNPPPDWWTRVAWSFAYGASEEIILVGLLFAILSRVQWRPGQKVLALTGWATALSAVLRTGFHTYHGFYALALIPVGWLLYRIYATHRMIIPLMVAHMTWDLVGGSAPWVMFGVLGGCLILQDILTKGSSLLATLDLRRKGDYWACWRWQKVVPEPVPQPTRVA